MWGALGSGVAFLWAIGLALRIAGGIRYVDGAGEWALALIAVAGLPVLTGFAAYRWIRTVRLDHGASLPLGALVAHATLLVLPLFGAFLALRECTNPTA